MTEKGKKMVVNKNRLEKIINSVTKGCNYCPLDNECETMGGTFTSCNERLRSWLTEFDIQTALEEGANIINDIAVFPSQEIKVTTGKESNASTM